MHISRPRSSCPSRSWLGAHLSPSTIQNVQLCRMIATLQQLVDDQTKKNPGFHTGLVKMYENEHQPPEKGSERCILSSFPVYGSEISVMMANSRNYRCTSVTNWSQITYLAPSAQQIGVLHLLELSATHYFARPGTHQFTNYLT